MPTEVFGSLQVDSIKLLTLFEMSALADFQSNSNGRMVSGKEGLQLGLLIE